MRILFFRSLDSFLDLIQKDFRMERFCHIIGSTRFHGEHHILNFCIAGHHDERHLHAMLSHPLQQEDAVVVGKAEV